MTSFRNFRRFLSTSASKPCFALYVILFSCFICFWYWCTQQNEFWSAMYISYTFSLPYSFNERLIDLWRPFSTSAASYVAKWCHISKNKNVKIKEVLMIVYGKSRWNRIHFKCSHFEASNVSPYLKGYILWYSFCPTLFLYFLEPYFNSRKALETILNIIKKDLG